MTTSSDFPQGFGAQGFGEVGERLRRSTVHISSGGHGHGTGIIVKSDGTIVIIVGDPGEGENTDAYSVAYERYQPGISERTITSLTQGKIVCQ